MERASQIFKTARLRKKISLKKAVESTKIPRQYLEAIEKDSHLLFPSFNYAQLYVRDYAAFLELSPQKMVSIFRRDWEGEGEKKVDLGGKKESLWQNFPLFTGSGLLIGGMILVAGIYLVRQYLVFNSPPPLKVNLSCLPGKVVIEGRTSREAAVKVGEESILVDAQGQFKGEIYSPYPQSIKVETQSPAGKIREKVLLTECE